MRCRHGILLFALALIVTGCTSWIARQIVEAPGTDATRLLLNEKDTATIETALELRTMRIPVGPPTAMLALTVVPPRDYGLEYESEISYSGGKGRLNARLQWADTENLGAVRETPRSTVILLSGATLSRYTVLPWALGLASQGYRAVIIDYRGHGDSTGQYITYGSQEARDLRQVIEALRGREVIEEPLVIFGISMGAVTALRAATELDSLAAIVAIEPYADAAEAIHGVGRGINPKLSRFVSEKRMDEAIDRASTIIGHDIRTNRPVDIMDQVHVPVLFIHGQSDHWIPPTHSMDLYAAKSGQADLWIVPGASHMDLPLRYDELSGQVFDWLGNVTKTRSMATNSE